MSVSKAIEQSNNLTDRAAQAADHAIKATQRVANDALDGLAGTVQDAHQAASPLLNRAAEQAGVMAQRGMDAVRDGSNQLREKARDASDSTVNYIKNEPVKAVLIAAATGAALMALIGLISRSRARA